MRDQTLIRLPSESKEKLQKDAKSKGVSFNEYLYLHVYKGFKKCNHCFHFIQEQDNYCQYCGQTNQKEIS